MLAVLLLGACSGALIACDGGGGAPGEDLEAPPPPSGLEATSQEGSVTLTWDAVAAADAYRVYRDTTAGIDASGSPVRPDLPAAEYVDETAENGTTYVYAVTAVVREGEAVAESRPSSERRATPFADPPTRPDRARRVRSRDVAPPLLQRHR
ncbi:MAG: fibronectin type III domain-containing protein [Salinivenus sp.]